MTVSEPTVSEATASETTVTGATVPGASVTGATAPHPGFAALAALHLRNLMRIHWGAWLLLATVVVGVPLLIFLLDLGPGLYESRERQEWVGRAAMALWFLQGATLVTWLLWPMMTWRHLPPGRRQAMDALPVARRTHRLARVAAGLVLPVVLMVVVWAGHLLFRARLAPYTLGASVPTERPDHMMDVVAYWPISPGVTLLALLAAYLLGSALALWRVPAAWSAFGLLLLVVVLPLAAFGMLGGQEGANAYFNAILEGTWSPARVAFLGFRAEPADLLPILAWLLPLGAVTWQLAAAHDRK